MSIRKGDTVIAGREQGATYNGVIHDNTLSGAGTQADPLSVIQPDVYHPSLFDYKYADYRLDEVSWLRSETFSWQNGAVYEAAFEHLKADMENEDTIQHTIPYKNNVTLYGNCQADTKGNLSGFWNAINYAEHPAQTPTSSWEYVVCFTTPGSWANNYTLVGASSGVSLCLRLNTSGGSLFYLSSNNSGWDIANGYSPGLTWTLNTKQWLKVTWDGSVYDFYRSTDGVNWTQGTGITNSSAVNITSRSLRYGHFLTETNTVFNNGIIHLPECYMKVDNSMYWKGTDNITYYHSPDNHNIVTASEADKVAEYFGIYKSANFFIYDSENERFKLPRKCKRTLVKSYRSNKDWYELYNDGWVKQGGYSSNIGYTSGGWTKTIILSVTMADSNYSISRTVDKNSIANDPSVRYTCGANSGSRTTKSFTMLTDQVGYVYGDWWQVEGYADVNELDFIPEKEYYYMGYFTPTALLNTGSLLESLNDKMDNDMDNIPSNVDFVIESWSDGTNWYRLYRSGWCEQGGRVYNSNNSTTTINLIKTYRDTNYEILHSMLSTGQTDVWGYGVKVPTQDTSYFTLYINNSTNGTIQWKTEGYVI